MFSMQEVACRATTLLGSASECWLNSLEFSCDKWTSNVTVSMLMCLQEFAQGKQGAGESSRVNQNAKATAVKYHTQAVSYLACCLEISWVTCQHGIISLLLENNVI